MQAVLPDTAFRTPYTAPAPAQTTTDVGWGERIADSFANAMTLLFAAIPRIIGFIIVLAIGWFIASLIARALASLLRTVRFNDFAQRIGMAGFTRRARVEMDPSAMVAAIVKWLVRIVVLLVAFDLLGLPAVSEVLREFLLWLPNLIVAIAVLLLAGVAAGALANVVRGAAAEAGFENPDTLANVARIAVWAFAVVIAVNQLGVARTLINTLLMGVIGALALATGLAFGLGGRDMAARKLEQWDQRAQGAGERMSDAARAARRNVGTEPPGEWRS